MRDEEHAYLDVHKQAAAAYFWLKRDDCPFQSAVGLCGILNYIV